MTPIFAQAHGNTLAYAEIPTRSYFMYPLVDGLFG